LILIANTHLNIFLKWAFHLPRPYWYAAEVDGLVPEYGFGAPSGHAQLPSSILGLVAVAVRRRWFWVSAMALAFLIGFSRLVLGAHFHLDVVAGWALGFLVLYLFLKFEAPVKAWFDRQSIGAGVGAAFVISLALILIGWGIVSSLSGLQIPQEWVGNALADQPDEPIDPLELTDVISTAASLFGVVTGALWLQRGGWYDAGGDTGKRILRFIIGVIGVLILLEGLGAVLPRNEDLLSYSLRYLRYGLVGLWITGVSPMLFIKLGIARRAQPGS
jgi:membrane-associated phospholipid phosphatase